MDLIAKDLEQPRIKPPKTTQTQAKKNKKAAQQSKPAEPPAMPLIERYKLENEAIVTFEGCVDQSRIDKDDYVHKICDQMNID